MTSSAVPAPTVARARRLGLGYRFARVALYAILGAGAVLMAVPFLWMVLTSLKSSQEALQDRPVWVPERARPANWAAAWRLGAQGGDPWWGGILPGRSVELEVRASGAVGLSATIPGVISVQPTNLFGAEDQQADPRQVEVLGPRSDGTDDVWTVRVTNGGAVPLGKVPLRVVVPNASGRARSSLPADRLGREDAGTVLQWSDVAPGVLGYVLANFRDALAAAPFDRYFLNSVVVATSQTLLGLVVVSLAAFAFARVPFLGRDLLFGMVLSSLVIPGEVLLVPNYVIVSRLGWLDSYPALIVPWIASVFGIFLLRQFFLSLPNELFEAARIDGAGYGRMLVSVGLPLARPGLVTFAIFSFLGSWNALLWPLIVTSRTENRTLQVGLQSFIGEAGTEYGQLMAASLMVILPIIVGFLSAQRQFVAGVARSGLK